MDLTQLFLATVKTIRLRLKAQRRSVNDSNILSKSSHKPTQFSQESKDLVSFNSTHFWLNFCCPRLDYAYFQTPRLSTWAQKRVHQFNWVRSLSTKYALLTACALIYIPFTQYDFSLQALDIKTLFHDWLREGPDRQWGTKVHSRALQRSTSLA